LDREAVASALVGEARVAPVHVPGAVGDEDYTPVPEGVVGVVAVAEPGVVQPGIVARTDVGAVGGGVRVAGARVPSGAAALVVQQELVDRAALGEEGVRRAARADRPELASQVADLFARLDHYEAVVVHGRGKGRRDERLVGQRGELIGERERVRRARTAVARGAGLLLEVRPDPRFVRRQPELEAIARALAAGEGARAPQTAARAT